MTTVSRTLPLGARARFSVARCVTALVLVVAAIAAVLGNEGYRGFEAAGAGLALRLVPDVATAWSGTVFTTLRHGSAVGFQITPECTALVLLVPLVLLAAALVLTTRAACWRILAAVAAMWAVVTLVNEFRLAVIGFTTLHWGIDPGYQIGHTFVGSVIGIVGFVAGLAVLLGVAVRKRTV